MGLRVELAWLQTSPVSLGEATRTANRPLSMSSHSDWQDLCCIITDPDERGEKSSLGKESAGEGKDSRGKVRQA